MGNGVCTFFGHANIHGASKELLHEILVGLIHEGIHTFYVGNQGLFDDMVRIELKKLAAEYPIDYAVVLAYHPGKKDLYDPLEGYVTEYPDEMADALPRFAIEKRNDWMLKRADTVVAYVIGHVGGAAKFVDKAERQGKRIINLAEIQRGHPVR